MHIVKGMQASLLHRSFSHQGRHYFTASALWGFRLGSGEPVLEQDLWTSLGDMLGRNELFDGGMPKSRGEFLVHQKHCSKPHV